MDLGHAAPDAPLRDAPLAATALVSGALLASPFLRRGHRHHFHGGRPNTLPLWIFGAIRLGQQLPEVNAVVTIVIALTLIPVILAARIAGCRRRHPLEFILKGTSRSGDPPEESENVSAGPIHPGRPPFRRASLEWRAREE